MSEIYHFLWGKTDDSSGLLHPLVFHMLDAGNVATELWSSCLPAAFKEEFSSHLGIENESAGRLISFWTALHDFGKASPAFQRKHPASENTLAALGLNFPHAASYVPARHGLVTGWILCAEKSILGGCLDDDKRESLARSLAGHHGSWPDSEEFLSPQRRENLGGEAWKHARQDINHILSQVFCPKESPSFPEEGIQRNIFLTLLSGLVSVADWLASMQHTFPAVGTEMDWTEYQPLSASQAHQAVIDQGWMM